jgi:signal transduction histidine kinase
VRPDLIDIEDEHPFEVSYGRDILVVDDNETNLIAIEAALSSLERKLVLARSGVEALARLLEQDFALIILDVAMPGMDGFEVAKMIRARDRNRATPIIFITGLTWEDNDVIRGYELGAFDFLIKPIRAEVLRAKALVFVQLQERTIELQHKAEELHEAQARAHEREIVMQRKRWESEAMEAQMLQLAEADRRKDEFLAILAHELRNPLQPLQTAVELIEQDPSKPVQPRVRGIIQRQVHVIGRLVDDLLDVARFTAGKLELRRELVTLDAIVDEAVDSVRAGADARHHSLRVDAPVRAPELSGDPVRLVQVMVNLLSNAIKYTAPNGAIAIAYGTGDDGMAFVRVSDNGRGIPATLLPKVFEMFVQERTTSDGKGGLGLGLGLVKRLVELHGGTVHAASGGPNQGSTFEIRLPIADAASEGERRTTRELTTPTPRSLRAIVCDDAPDLRELVADLLRTRGHEVLTVEDGAACVEAVRRDHPDVALIDIGLPEMDGYEVARRIRAQYPDTSLRLIAMTGYGQASDRASAFQAGFDAHIVKPASADKILRALYGKTEE